jgi:uncharacterized protein
MAVPRKKGNKKSGIRSKDDVISDGKTRVTPLPKEQKKFQKSPKLKRPLLIAGFPGPGLVGSISANYIIQELDLHQIAYVESEYIMPGVIFTGGTLRHPFRLYADDGGDLCVLICEIPISGLGIYSVFNVVIQWAKKFGVSEIIVLEGIPMEGIPPSDRKSLVLSHNGKTMDTAFIPDLGDDQKQEKKGGGGGGDNDPAYKVNDMSYYKEGVSLSSSSSLPDPLDGVGKKKHYERPESGYTAIMSGVSGGLLTSCLSNGIACKGIIIHTTANVPDPEAASILIETINELRDNQLNINVEDLKNKGKLIKKQLEEMIKTVMEQQQQQNPQSVNTKGTTMYS